MCPKSHNELSDKGQVRAQAPLASAAQPLRVCESCGPSPPTLEFTPQRGRLSLALPRVTSLRSFLCVQVVRRGVSWGAQGLFTCVNPEGVADAPGPRCQWKALHSWYKTASVSPRVDVLTLLQ